MAGLLLFAASAVGIAGSEGAWVPLPPADTGKPPIGLPDWKAPAPSDLRRCLPALPCGTRLLGTIRKNGAVELQVPALRW